MKIILSLFIIGLFTVPIWIKSTYMIIPNYNLEKDFGIVASVSEANSINDIIGRPLHTNEMNQYYFKDANNYINLMQPNIGISFSYDYNGNKYSVVDRIKLRLPKIFDCGIFSIVNIDSLIKNNFFYSEKSGFKFLKRKFFFFQRKL